MELENVILSSILINEMRHKKTKYIINKTTENIIIPNRMLKGLFFILITRFQFTVFIIIFFC
ncbi:hypothetical protein AC599_21055 [Yersinia pestis subsp. microtus bv. Altaica]|nr:hypothetical protein AC599_21055 [Yersinia pestis subsp. microtus bv. Altaica]